VWKADGQAEAEEDGVWAHREALVGGRLFCLDDEELDMYGGGQSRPKHALCLVWDAQCG
jgi:hypothetical protein